MSVPITIGLRKLYKLIGEESLKDDAYGSCEMIA